MMTYSIEFSSQFEKSMKRLKKRDKGRFTQITKKLLELVDNPEHFKPLRNDLAGFRRIHFGPYVLVFSIEKDIVRIISLEHHDKAY